MVSTEPGDTRVAFRTCPLCEAGCGLEITLHGTNGSPRVGRIRGDRDDVFSHGFICPKGSTLRQLHEDPDWLRRPMVKRDGGFVPVSWDEAFAEVERRLLPIIERLGRDAVGIYVGNPNAHSLAGLIYLRPLIRALGTTNVFSASTVDQRPKEVASGLMFGGGLTVPVPDVDRTDFLLMLGANPYASNGSLATAPDWPGRIEALLARGGRLVVVDPRRSQTAAVASEHLAIRAGADPFLLMALVNVLAADALIDLGATEPYVAGVDEVVRLAEPFTPEAVSPVTGLPADAIRRLAHELAGAPSACVYGRIGTTTAEFGTLTSWLVDVLNTLTGNLDRPGGAMFTRAAAGASNTRGTPRYGRGLELHRRRSRVRGLGETLGELPAACLAEEIDTPGDGQIRAMVTVGGNPVVSTPNAGRLDAALAGLEFMVAVDPYINETTRHADVIMPVPSALQRPHYDLALLQLGLRNVANYSPAVLPLDEGQPDEWHVLARLALVAQGMGSDADPGIVDELVLRTLVDAAVGDETSQLAGRDADEIVALLGERTGPERIIDLMLRTGPYGEGFGANPDGLTLDVLLANPHGVDLGPLEPRLPDVLRTPSGMVELAPEPIVADVDRLRAALDRPAGGLSLIGRRDLRSNNSWMHNVEVLVKGKPRCTLHVNPGDAERLGLADGEPAEVRSRAGTVTIAVEVTDAIRLGVVSIPHGWGHDMPGVELAVARRYPGVNSNVLADEELIDPVSGTAVLNGIPVEVAPAPA
ncbi:MAG TPA: molybdopterin oxidoreductase family protein [Acidimicrobiales bacterium]|nr:molybdopterin oxidoreductase family protein [Acidimicrobiales bacterium]